MAFTLMATLGMAFLASGQGLLARSSTQAATPSGPVVALGFNEKSGKALADSSGLRHTATTTALRSAEGRYGRGLAFDSSPRRLDVPKRAVAELTDGFTLETWIKPVTGLGARVTVVRTKDGSLSYVVSAATGRRAGAGEATRASVDLRARSWSHLSGSYDGSELRLFVNGRLARVASMKGASAPSRGALRTQPTTSGRRLSGLIDELRIYPRPLSQREVKSSMKDRIQPPPKTPRAPDIPVPESPAPDPAPKSPATPAPKSPATPAPKPPTTPAPKPPSPPAPKPPTTPAPPPAPAPTPTPPAPLGRALFDGSVDSLADGSTASSGSAFGPWRSTNYSNGGAITVDDGDDAPVRFAGRKTLRYLLPSAAGRAEMTSVNEKSTAGQRDTATTQANGQTNYISFAIYARTSPQTGSWGWLPIQGKSLISNTHPDGLSPQVSLVNSGSGTGLSLRTIGGEASSRVARSTPAISSLTPGTWYDVMIGVRADVTTAGWAKVWIVPKGGAMNESSPTAALLNVRTNYSHSGAIEPIIWRQGLYHAPASSGRNLDIVMTPMARYASFRDAAGYFAR